jgi:uncharacterized protein YbjT (DUF2867 family)
MKVLMIGATGHYASLLLPELTRRGATVRALIRDESKVAEAKGHGTAEIAIGDLRKPETLSKGVEGVDGVFHLGPAFAPDESEMGVTMRCQRILDGSPCSLVTTCQLEVRRRRQSLDGSRLVLG